MEYFTNVKIDSDNLKKFREVFEENQKLRYELSNTEIKDISDSVLISIALSYAITDFQKIISLYK